MQLHFPFVAPDYPVALLCEEELAGVGDKRLAVHVWETRSGMRMRMRATNSVAEGAAHAVRDELELLLHVRESARCLVGGQAIAWNLQPDGENERGPFSAAAEWALRQLCPDAWYGGAVGASGLIKRLESIADVAAARAVQACEPSHRDMALRFAPRTRFFVYRLLVADNTGRVAQLVESVPGLITALSQLYTVGAPLEEMRLVQDVVNGRRRRDIVNDAVRRWWRMFGDPSAERSRAAPIQRGLWLRASAGIPASMLTMTPPPGIALTDVPPDHAQQRSWWAIVSALTNDRRAQGLPVAARGRLAGFLSAHAAELHRIAGEHHLDDVGLVGEVMDYVMQNRARPPCRRSCPRRVLDDVRAWHERAWLYAGIGPHADIPLPPGPCVQDVVRGLRVEALGTSADLAREGQAMRNCVASQVHDALRDGMFFYHGRFEEERLTIAIQQAGGTWVLSEVASFANRPPSVAADAAVRRWITKLNTGLDPE